MRKLIIFLLCFSVGGLQAGTPNFQQKMEEIFKLLARPTFAKDNKAQNQVTNTFDFMQMSRQILGPEAKKQGAAEVEWFAKTLQKIVTKTVYPEAYDFLKGVKFSYEDVEKSGKGYSLLAIVNKRGEETEVLITFAKSAKGWKVVDVAIDDESWVENIRDQVLRTIKKEGWSGLKRSMNRRLAKLNKKGKK